MAFNFLNQFSFNPKTDVEFYEVDGAKFAGTKENPITDGEGNPIPYEDYLQSEQYGSDLALQGITGQNVNTLGAGITAGGQALNTFNMDTERPSAGIEALSGGLAGFGQGGLLGGLFGAATGAIGALQESTQNAQQEYQNTMQMYGDATVQPKSFDLGGAVESILGDNYVPIQAEKGDSGKEMMLLPDLTLTETGATKSHDEMEDDEITDIVPEDTFIFSASEDRSLDLSEIADDVIGLAIGSYDEQEDNYSGDLITISDIFGGKGEFTFSELTEKTKKKYPTMYEDEDDIFTNDTNEENKTSRMPILEYLIAKQEGQDEDNTVVEPLEQFGKGGWVKKYQGTPGKSNVVGIREDLKGVGQIPPLDGFRYSPTLQEPSTAISPLSFLQPLNNTVQSQQNTIPTETNRVGTPSVPSQLPASGGMNPYPAPPDITSTIEVDGGQTQGTESNSIFDDYRSMYDTFQAQAEGERQRAQQEYGDFYGRESTRNLLSGFGQTLGILGQGRDVETPRMGTRFLREAQPRISRTDIEQQKSELRRSQQGLLNYLAESGAKPGQIAQLAAPTQARLLEQERQLEQQAKQVNQQRDAEYFRSLQEAENYNRQQEASEFNQEQGLRRQQIAGVTRAGQQTLSNMGRLDADKLANMRQIDKSYNDSRMNTMLAQQELMGMEQRLEAWEQRHNQLMKAIQGLQ